MNAKLAPCVGVAPVVSTPARNVTDAYLDSLDEEALFAIAQRVNAQIVFKKQQAEEQARKAEEARKLAEEQARKAEEARKLAEEEAARKLAEEQARKAEEARKLAEEDAARKLAEEQARKAEAARKLAEEARKLAEEEAARKLVEEARKLAEEEAARKLAEEEARKAEEARKLAEEEARKAEEARKLAEQEQIEAEKNRLQQESIETILAELELDSEEQTEMAAKKRRMAVCRTLQLIDEEQVALQKSVADFAEQCAARFSNLNKWTRAISKLEQSPTKKRNA